MHDPAIMKLDASNICGAQEISRYERIIDGSYYVTHDFTDAGLNVRGGDDWTQTGYLHNVLGFDLNTTDLAGELTTAATPFQVSL